MSARASVAVCLALSAALLVPAGALAQAPAYRIAFQSDRGGTKGDLWLVDSNGAHEEQLTQTPVAESSPAWSPDGRSIVYSCALDGNWDVCRIDVATREVTRLTRTPTAEFDPRYTSDGTRIVVETYTNDRNADIAVVPAAGGVPVLMTVTAGVDDQDPAPDPAGARIAFASGGKILVSDSPLAGSITPVGGGSGSDTDPSFSSRDEIVFGGRLGGIAVAGPAGANGQRLTRQLTRPRTRCVRTKSGRLIRCRALRAVAPGVVADIQPVWSVDGTELYFARMRTTDRGFRIFAMDAAGKGERPVTAGGAYDDIEPAAGPPAGIGLLERSLRVHPFAAVGACNPITGTVAANTLRGNANRNCMRGGGGDDKLYGAAGDDQLYGSVGNDHLHGGPGDDKLTGDSGRDVLYGDAGADAFNTTDGERDVVVGGPGTDEASSDTGLDVKSSMVEH